MKTHLTRQAVFSRATFGPGQRRKGVTDHIKKELKEVEKDAGDPAARNREWADVAILGLDGLLRSIADSCPSWSYDHVAQHAVELICEKQGINEKRDWPDWRTAAPDQAIEHVRT
ncbi:MAG: dATP/dGTP pyrophosphohydrolase domain-containing protein [Pseudomonadota bacterium]